VIETVVAFANAQGGQIIIGVADDGKLLGVQLNPETVKDWLNQIKNNTYPSVLPDMGYPLKAGQSEAAAMHLERGH
jgi:ATP-dependent DNA helicase RecG